MAIAHVFLCDQDKVCYTQNFVFLFFRLLGINATRRGVKTCPLCTKKIGYRSKQCKYCSFGKQKRSRSRKVQSKDSGKAGQRIVDLEIGVQIENETEVSTSNTAEVSSTGEDTANKAEEVSEATVTESYEQDTQSSINAIEGLEAETSQQNSSDMAAGKRSYHTSLQDLIHTLLVQNQNSSVYIAPETEVQADKAGTEIQDPDQQEEQGGDVETEQGQDNTLVPAGTVRSPENAYDANSVALFLGHLAQQNGKKIRTVLDPVSGNTQPSTSASSLIRFKTKHVIVEDDMSSQAKYRKIRPKSVDEGSAVMEIQPSVDSTVAGDVGDSVAEVKPTESQIRYVLGKSTISP